MGLRSGRRMRRCKQRARPLGGWRVTSRRWRTYDDRLRRRFRTEPLTKSHRSYRWPGDLPEGNRLKRWQRAANSATPGTHVNHASAPRATSPRSYGSRAVEMATHRMAFRERHRGRFDAPSVTWPSLDRGSPPRRLAVSALTFFTSHRSACNALPRTPFPSGLGRFLFDVRHRPEPFHNRLLHNTERIDEPNEFFARFPRTCWLELFAPRRLRHDPDRDALR